MSSAQWFDALVIGLMVLFALKYLASGLIREVFGIGGIIGGIYIAAKYKMQAGEWITKNVYDLTQNGVIEAQGTQMLSGFIATLFCFWIVCLIVGEILSKLINLSGLGIINHLGGAIFGVAKIFLILSVITALTQSAILLNKQTHKYVENSLVFPYLVKFGSMIIGDLKFSEFSNSDLLNLDTNLTTHEPKISSPGDINDNVILDSNETNSSNQVIVTDK